MTSAHTGPIPLPGPERPGRGDPMRRGLPSGLRGLSGKGVRDEVKATPGRARGASHRRSVGDAGGEIRGRRPFGRASVTGPACRSPALVVILRGNPIMEIGLTLPGEA